MEEVMCPRCKKETPAEKYENRYYSGWHYFCVHCNNHWTPEEKEKAEVTLHGILCDDDKQFHVFLDVEVNSKKYDVHLQAHKKDIQKILDDDKPLEGIRDIKEYFKQKEKEDKYE